MNPPSTLITCPVTALAASDASSVSAAPISRKSWKNFRGNWISRKPYLPNQPYGSGDISWLIRVDDGLLH